MPLRLMGLDLDLLVEAEPLRLMGFDPDLLVEATMKAGARTGCGTSFVGGFRCDLRGGT